MTDSEHIIQFFSNIFILQSVPPDDRSWQREYKLIPSGVSADCTYELRISKGADVKTRRMSIRQIGTPGQSKSTCYMVTYDDFLVIKIPSVPLFDFESYLENVEIEKNISEQLNPTITSLSPGLAGILGRIPEISKKLNQTEKASEEAYVRLLKKEPLYQQYLKIDGQFVFFMELSQYAFFDQVIINIHSDKERISEEIIKYSHVFDDPLSFGEVYGSDKDDIFGSVNDLCKHFQLKLDNFLTQHSAEQLVADYEKREWLFKKLAGLPIEIDRNQSVSELSNEIDQLFDQLVGENGKTVQGFLELVRESVHKKIFDNHRTGMEALIVKILEVLCRLKETGVAIRDLKPDNMLLVGDREYGQYSLADPDQYDLGLIDLETAVAFNGSEDGMMRQPMLAGTPSYMTPSHLFSNTVLNDVFEKNMPVIFCLQDWFAAVGIVFCIATGQRLFEKTAKLLPEIVRVKKRGLKRNDPEAEILKNVSRIFWKTAGDEFSEKIRTNMTRLENIQLTLSDPIVDLFRSEAQSLENRIRDDVDQCANYQKLFPKQASKLISASVDAVRAQKISWENKEPEANVSADIREQAIRLFQQLETFKLQLKNLDENCRLIQTNVVSCEKLLRFIFNQVAIAMQCA